MLFCGLVLLIISRSRKLHVSIHIVTCRSVVHQSAASSHRELDQSDLPG
jgi:hypothetical protein